MSDLNDICSTSNIFINNDISVDLSLSVFSESNSLTHLLHGKIGAVFGNSDYLYLLILKIMNISNEKSYEIFISEIVPLSVVKSLKLSNANTLIIGHININSIRHKFDELKYIIQGNIDICYF